VVRKPLFRTATHRILDVHEGSKGENGMSQTVNQDNVVFGIQKEQASPGVAGAYYIAVFKDGNVLLLNSDEAGATNPPAQAAPATSKGSSSIPLVVKVTLTTAQIKALRATPLVIIPAPGAGRSIMLEQIMMRLVFVSAAYTAANADLDIFMGPASDAVKAIATAEAILLATANATSWVPVTGPSTAADADMINQPVRVGNSGAAEFLAGDSPLEIMIKYHILVW
jgi:hypothetical protein